MRDDRRAIAVAILAARITADPELAWRNRRAVVRQAFEWATDVLLCDAQQRCDADGRPLDNPAVTLPTAPRRIDGPCAEGYAKHKWQEADPRALRTVLVRQLP